MKEILMVGISLSQSETDAGMAGIETQIGLK